uniref:Uncharacterized protein n=1 Tax=Glossina pallidipes TaxID=7398 RepID=A0A1A9ZPT3_GLOPL
MKKQNVIENGNKRITSLLFSAIHANESLDTREGVDLVLKCRFTEHYDSKDFTFYWARWTCCPTQFENVAIGDIQLNSNYRIQCSPEHLTKHSVGGRHKFTLTEYLPENDKYEPQKTIKAVPIFWLPLHHQQQL